MSVIIALTTATLIISCIFMMRYYKKTQKHRENIRNELRKRKKLIHDQITSSVTDCGTVVLSSSLPTEENNIDSNNKLIMNFEQTDLSNNNFDCSSNDFDLINCYNESSDDDKSENEIVIEKSQHDLSQFRSRLVSMFLNANINHSQGDQILTVLRTHSCFQFLPCVTKTLLQTPRQCIQIIKIGEGEYYHIGFKKQIIKKLQVLPLHVVPNHLEIDIHTDGMSIHKSSRIQLWPIQFRIVNLLNNKAAIIGVYMGKRSLSMLWNFLSILHKNTKVLDQMG